MSDLIAIGSSAVLAYRNALNAVGDNVANSETAGYVRRSVVMSEGPVTGQRGGARFSGVTGTQIARNWDNFLAHEVRDASSAASASATERDWLVELEAALDDGPTGVGQTTGAVFVSASRLAADPASTTARRHFLASLDMMATSFRSTASAISGLADGVAQATEAHAEAASATLRALDLVNRELRSSPAGSAERAALEDRRDAALTALAKDLGYSASFADNGAVTLTAAAAPQLPLLDANGPARLVATRSTHGLVTLQLTSDAGTVDFLPDGGALLGLADAASAIAGKRSALDTLALDSMARFNAWSAAGLDADGTAGAPLLGGSAAADIAVIVRAPEEVAAATHAAANGNLLALASLRGVGGLEQRWSSLVTDNAAALSRLSARADAHAAVEEGAMRKLDSLAGVDLDREAADLVRLQQAYSGAARVLQVARDMLDTLFNATS